MRWECQKLRHRTASRVNSHDPTSDLQRLGAGSRRVGSWSAGRIALRLVIVAVNSLALVACRQDMHDAPRYEPLEQSTFFGDGRSARAPVANTVARGQLRDDEHYYTGKLGGELATTFPMPVTAAIVARGQDRFNVFCSPCHGRTGKGDGMIVQRGFRAPPSFHEERLRNVAVGHFIDVETNGFGAMQDYSAQVPIEDRWAIAAYIRALQLSERGTIDDVPADRRADLDRPASVAAPETERPQEAR